MTSALSPGTKSGEYEIADGTALSTLNLPDIELLALNLSFSLNVTLTA